MWKLSVAEFISLVRFKRISSWTTTSGVWMEVRIQEILSTVEVGWKVGMLAAMLEASLWNESLEPRSSRPTLHAAFAHCKASLLLMLSLKVTKSKTQRVSSHITPRFIAGLHVLWTWWQKESRERLSRSTSPDCPPRSPETQSSSYTSKRFIMLSKMHGWISMSFLVLQPATTLICQTSRCIFSSQNRNTSNTINCHLQ